MCEYNKSASYTISCNCMLGYNINCCVEYQRPCFPCNTEELTMLLNKAATMLSSNIAMAE